MHECIVLYISHKICNVSLGHEVVIIKDGMRACGSGGVLGNAPLVQSKSYFEVKLQQSGKTRARTTDLFRNVSLLCNYVHH